MDNDSAITVPARWNFTAFESPIDRAALRTAQDQWTIEDGVSLRTSRIVRLIGGIFLGCVLLAIAAGTAWIATGLITDGNLGGGLVIVAIAVVVVAGIWTYLRSAANRDDELRFRLSQFANDNGATYQQERKEQLPGFMFRVGQHRRTTHVVSVAHERYLEIGTHEFSVGTGDRERESNWTYIAIRLNSPLPHIVLDAEDQSDVRFSALPFAIDKNQRLSLEGDFDRYFSLYCPRGYERDALYLFTPDVMQRFINTAPQLDVEIIDEWLFLYRPTVESGDLDSETWKWMVNVTEALSEKLYRWERWRDDRSPDVDQSATRRSDATALKPPVHVGAKGKRLGTGRRFATSLLAAIGLMAVCLAGAWWIGTV